MSYHVKTTLCHNDIRYIVAVLTDTPTNLTQVPVQQLLAQVPMTSVPTKIYRSKVTIIFHDHAPHLEGGGGYQTLVVTCVNKVFFC